MTRRILLTLLLLGLSSCSKPPVPSPLSVGQPAPELDGALTWINSPPLRLADVRGKVVSLDFFDYSCVNCIRTFPYLKEWLHRYAADGLVIIGVHDLRLTTLGKGLSVYSFSFGTCVIPRDAGTLQPAKEAS